MSAPSMGRVLAGDKAATFSLVQETTAQRNLVVRATLARGPSRSRLSDAFAMDFGPYRGDPVLGGPDGFEGIQGPERIRRDPGRALCRPCARIGSMGVDAVEFRLCAPDAGGGSLCLFASANWRR